MLIAVDVWMCGASKGRLVSWHMVKLARGLVWWLQYAKGYGGSHKKEFLIARFWQDPHHAWRTASPPKFQMCPSVFLGKKLTMRPFSA